MASSPRPSREPLGLEPAPVAALLGEPGPAAHQPLPRQHGDREQHHQRGQLHRRAEVVGALPDRVDAHRDGLHAEVLHGREVRQHLHHHQRQAGGQRRPGQRHQHPEERPAATGAERPGGVVRRGGLLGERRPRQEVDVGVEGQRHHQDAAPERAHGELHALPEHRPQPLLHRPGGVERREEDEAEDVGGHRQRQHQQPDQHVAQREGVRRHQPGQAAADHQGADADPGHQQQRGDHHVAEVARPVRAARRWRRRSAPPRPARPRPPRSAAPTPTSPVVRARWRGGPGERGGSAPGAGVGTRVWVMASGSSADYL